MTKPDRFARVVANAKLNDSADAEHFAATLLRAEHRAVIRLVTRTPSEGDASYLRAQLLAALTRRAR